MNKKFFLLIFAFVSCTNSEKPAHEKIDFPRTVNLNLSEAIEDSMNLSEIAYKVEYIPLQTTDSSLMGYFWNYAITKDYFFIVNELSVLTFDKYGKYINSLFRIGSGPGEANAYCIAVDEDGEKVFIYDHIIGNVKIYDFHGKYIKTIKKSIRPPGSWGYSIGFFNNNLLVQTTQRPLVKYLYSCFDLANDSIRILCKNYRSYNKSQEGKTPYAPYDYHYQITDSTILYKESYNDTIFAVNKMFSQTPRYIINLGNQKLDWDTWRDCAFNLAGGPPNGYKVQSFVETETFLFLVLQSFIEPQIFVVYNKITNSTNIFKNKDQDPSSNQVYLENNLDNIIPFPPMNKDGYLFYYEGCLYSVIEANDFARVYKSTSSGIRSSSKYLKNMAPVYNNITGFSNPIIMKVYLK
jgi:hypothetical protein